MLKRLHSTNQSNLDRDLNLNYEYHKHPFNLKPNGLWYSFENENISDWIDWCQSNEFRLDDYIYHYELEIDLSNILVITTKKELSQFINNFEIDESFYIDWNKLKKHYDGIEFNFNSYIYSYDLSFMRKYWISSLDVKSGCIWNLKSLINIKKYEKLKIIN